MSRVRTELSVVQFQVQTRQASASMDALGAKSEDLNTHIERVKKNIADLGNVPLNDANLVKYQGELKQLTSDLRDVTRAQNELMKGVKAADKLWQAAKTGTMESLSVKEIEAGIRGMKVRQKNLQPGDKDAVLQQRAMKAAIEEGEIAIRKFEADVENLMQTISAGGRVSDETLRKAKSDLEGLLDIIPRGTDEWNQYNAQLKSVKGYVSSLSDVEKRLAGEVVTAADAMKMAGAASEQAAQKRQEAAQITLSQVEREREAAQEAVQASKKRLQASEEQLPALDQEITKQKELVQTLRNLDDAEDKAFSDSLRAEEAMRKQREETGKFTDAVWEAAKKVGELERQLKELNEAPTTSTNPTLEKLKAEAEAATSAVDAAKQKLEEVNGRSIFGNARYNELDSQIKTLDELIAVSDKYKSQFFKMSDAAYEKGYMGKKKGWERADTAVFRAKDYLQEALQDRIGASILEMQPDPNDTWSQESAKRVAGGIVQNAQESVRRAIYKEIQEGKLTSSEIENRIAEYKNMMGQAAHGAYDLRTDPEYNAYKYLIAQMEKYIEVAQKVEAERKKIAGNEPFLEATKSDVLNDVYGEGLQHQRDKRVMEQIDVSRQFDQQKQQAETKAHSDLVKAEDDERSALERLDQAKKESNQTDEKKKQLTDQLAKANEDLAKAKQDAEEPTRKLEEAEKNYAEAQKKEAEATANLQKAKQNSNLDAEEQKLDALEQRHKEITQSIENEKQAQQGLNQAAAEATQKETDAQIEMAQAQNQSQESMEKSITLLEQYNKENNEPGGKNWEETEIAIGKLKTRLEELKRQSAELRGEVMSLDDALALAGSAGGQGFKSTSEQLQKAEDTLVKALKTTDKGTKEWEEYRTALERVRTEMNNAGMTSERMHKIMDDPTAARNLNELRDAVKRAKAELALMEGTVDKNSKEYQQLAESTKKAEFRLKELENQSKGTASAFDKAWSRLKTYVGLYMGAAVAIQKLTGALGDLMELSDKMGEVRKTTGYTADEVGRLSDSLAKLDTRTPIQELLGLSAAAGQLGLKAQDDVRGFTEAANKLIVALPEMGRESATSLMKIANATGDLKRNEGDVQETLERVGSTIISLRANSASAAPAITDFVSRVGAVGAQAGITIDQIAAMGSTIDALGGRVEMSATALSRMIPAIRNNSFAVANAIGVTEKYLNSLSAMDQLVLVFRKMRESIKGIDTSTEEGMSQMADNVEALLNKNATMAEVMKELNQQGARAGIVFGLMSQNVDELERQLEIAGEAYRENTSLMKEYNNMNETAAAQWARLKNQLEEMFVSDKMQRGLTWIIKRLRDIVDLISMDGPFGDAIRYGLIYLGLLRAKWAEAIGSGIISIFKFLAAVRAATAVTVADTAAKTANAAATEAVATATADAAVKTNIFAKAWGKMSEAMKANVVTAVAMAVWYLGSKLLDMHHEAKAAAEAMRNLKEKTDEEKSAVEKLFKPLRDANLQEEEKRKLINAINSQYGTYLSKMLTEASNAQEIARAYEAINLQLEKKNTLEGMNANRKNVEEKKKGKLDSSFSALDKYIIGGSSNLEEGARLTSDITGIIKKGIEDGLSRAQVEEKVGDLLKQRAAGGQLKEQTLASGQGRADWVDTQNLIKSAALSYFDTQQSVEKEVKQVNKRLQADLDNITKSVREAADDDIPELIQSFDKALSKGKDAKKYSAEESTAVVNAFDAIKAYYDLHKDELADYQKILLNSKMETSIKDFRDKAYASGGGGGTNPYGNYNKVTSPYEDWNASDLVNRRKEMLERVKALAAGADVQAVLSEDAKFITEATRQNIKTTKDAIEWYNTERLKIQDALHEKHLTNSGDWMDPKKGGRKASKLVQDEMKYYLDELDAYYTERKASIQEARNDEEISEAEARNRTLANEAEWHQRRANLQKLYSKQRKEVADEEEKAIFDIISERTGDTTDYIKKDIKHTINFIEKVGSEKGKPAMDKILGDIDLGIEKDFLRQRNAIGQHLKAIEDIINKENPFNGIVENLRKNLGTMDILLADIKKEEERTVDKEIERTMFIMEQATKGYGLTWEQMMRDMAKRGWQAWADAIQNDTAMQTGLMHQVTKVFEQIQDAIKKEASELKKQAEIMWSNILLPGGDGRTTVKDAFEQTIGALGIQEGRVSRANSLIGAGQASERVADKLAIQQLKVQLAMQQYQYNLMRKQGQEKIAMLRKEAKMYEDIGDMEKARALRMQADNAAQALNLATRKEQTEELKMQEQIIARTEESQARLYKELREWGDLIASSVQSVMEASNTGNAEYYNEMAKLQLTGETKGSQQYIIIDNAGTSDATAHYETLSETQALERQHEIEQQNATAEAWKKVMDDINQKMNDMITDQINAMFQNQAVDANTDALGKNTEAILALTGKMGGEAGSGVDIDTSWASKQGLEPGSVAGENNFSEGTPTTETPTGETPSVFLPGQEGGFYPQIADAAEASAERQVAAIDKVQYAFDRQFHSQEQGSKDANNKMAASAQSAFAKMTQAANLYGIAYQAMSNDNLSAAQKFGMIAVQAAGNAAITALTTNLSEATGEAATSSATVWGKLWSQLGWWAIPVYALFTGTLGGLMGLAASKIAKSKSEIASTTGASNSVASGRLTTGMLTYAEGNVNEFTDPDTLTPGKSYNVDAADGKTYRAKYTGRNPKTHITNGPEFHLAGEAGREMIIDAGTTRQITMNEREIFHAIQTLSGGGRLRRSSARRGIGAFASGNLDDFEDEMVNGQSSMVNGGDMSMEMMTSMQETNSRLADLLEQALTNGIKAVNKWDGPDGIPNMYNKYQKEAARHGEKYL